MCVTTSKHTSFSVVLRGDGTCLNVNNMLNVLQWDGEYSGGCLVGSKWSRRVGLSRGCEIEDDHSYHVTDLEVDRSHSGGGRPVVRE